MSFCSCWQLEVEFTRMLINVLHPIYPILSSITGYGRVIVEWGKSFWFFQNIRFRAEHGKGSRTGNCLNNTAAEHNQPSEVHCTYILVKEQNFELRLWASKITTNFLANTVIAIRRVLLDSWRISNPPLNVLYYYALLCTWPESGKFFVVLSNGNLD